MSGPGNSINETTTGISGFTGTAFVGSPVTQYNVLIGSSTSSTITNVAPSATSGVPLVSQGSSANPSFTTAVVAGGGTGVTSFTAYAVICGGTTSTAALQSIASVGTSNQVLTSNGAGALPTFQSISATSAFTQTVIQVFSSSGTYTPTTGMKYCIMETIGGGGGGGGVGSTAGSNISGGGGGGAGGYAQIVSTAATVGASQTVTIGAAGSAGSSAGGAGGNGGATSVGTICVAGGGNGGTAGSISAAGGAGGTGTTGTVLIQGNAGTPSITVNPVGWNLATGGQGAGGVYGGAPVNVGASSGFSTAGNAPGSTAYGSGGGGAAGCNSGSGQAGGAGAKGYVIITEFLSV